MTAAHDTPLQALVDQIQQARRSRTPLDIRGGNTKAFYGEAPRGEPLDVRPLAGIASHEPTELVVTARAGTPLAELEAALARHGQWLPFEPPRFAPGGTVGGMVATALNGPARAANGALRDHVLGLTLLNGKGELLGFGGRVMKNVAGYDVSRLVAGSLGVLGVICEVSLKVMPMPPAQLTLCFEQDQAAALKALNTWAGRPLPLQASAWRDGMLAVRLAGSEAGVQAAARQLGGEVMAPAAAVGFWRGLRDHGDDFFGGARQSEAKGAALWRLSLPSTAPALNLPGQQLIEWGGAQRWWCTTAPAAAVRMAALQAGGHATLFRSRDKSAGVFSPLDAPLERIHRELKRAFDPDRILNPGRFYPWI